MRAVYNAAELAELTDTNERTIYKNRDTFPVPAITVGRRVVWPKAAVDRLLGIAATNDEAPASMPGPVTATSPESPRRLTTERQPHDT